MKKSQIMSWILILGLVVLTVINIYTYCSENVYRNLDILQVGGEDNWNELQKAFETKKYQEGQKSEWNRRKEQVKNPSVPVNQQKQKGSTETLKGTSVMDELSKIKEKNSFINGPKDARFTILEYSEIVCPFCQRHANDGTLKKVMEQFKGEVNVIHVPYLVHPQAQKVEEGVLCAKDQKDATAYYDLLEEAFALPATTQESFVNLAKEKGYNIDVLSKCIDDGKYADKLTEQTADARSLFDVKGTPGNVIIDTKTGKFYNVAGAYPTSEFINRINEMKGTEESEK